MGFYRWLVMLLLRAVSDAHVREGQQWLRQGWSAISGQRWSMTAISGMVNEPQVTDGEQCLLVMS